MLTQRQCFFLQALQHASSRQERAKLLQVAPKDIVDLITGLNHNILHGKISIHPRALHTLYKYKQNMRKVDGSKSTSERRHQLQKGNGLLNHLLPMTYGPLARVNTYYPQRNAPVNKKKRRGSKRRKRRMAHGRSVKLQNG